MSVLGIPLTNRLIDALPREERNEVLALLQPVPMPLRAPLFGVGETPRYVHFMTSGIASSVSTLPGGDAVEVGITGREGFAEAFHILGPMTTDSEAFMQVEGTALRMDFKRFREEMSRRPALREMVLRFVQYQCFMTSQLAACNRLHDVEERLARWMLMVADRLNANSMLLTQELLAQMIGARRSTVTLAAGALQRSGLIEYRRGLVTITDRAALMDTACECYPVTTRLFDTLYQ